MPRERVSNSHWRCLSSLTEIDLSSTLYTRNDNSHKQRRHPEAALIKKHTRERHREKCKKEFRSGGEFCGCSFLNLKNLHDGNAFAVTCVYVIAHWVFRHVFAGPRSKKLKRKEKKPEDKRPRTAFTSEQLARLKREFQVCYRHQLSSRDLRSRHFTMNKYKFQRRKTDDFRTFSIVDPIAMISYTNTKFKA
jgi:hypothetical protein